MRLFCKRDKDSLSGWLKDHSNQCRSAGLMLLCGGMTAAIAEAGIPDVQLPAVEEISDTRMEPENEIPEEQNITRP
ncbi:MAG: hypothetical protein LUC94_00070, partial [Clostridiales bacterium]|nr:hypothetical protein [Clostridiales bacterium]